MLAISIDSLLLTSLNWPNCILETVNIDLHWVTYVISPFGILDNLEVSTALFFQEVCQLLIVKLEIADLESIPLIVSDLEYLSQNAGNDPRSFLDSKDSVCLSRASLSIGHNRHIPSPLKTLNKRVSDIFLIHLFWAATFLDHILKCKFMFKFLLFVSGSCFLCSLESAMIIESHKTILPDKPSWLALEGKEGSKAN